MTTRVTGGDVYVGLMSGTSLDGISAAVARFHEDGLGSAGASLLASITTPYSAAQRDRIQRSLTGGSAAEYCRLGFDLGEWLAAAAALVIAESGVARSEIRAIGSHGQTIWHEPPHSTWQLGEAAVIAERIGVDVVSNFRVRDVAAGGQGAPLVPIADTLLWSASDHWRALLNLGGIGNVTIVPPGGDQAGVRAFDTGPGVAIVDGVVRLLVPSLTYDQDGAIAASGVAIDPVVDELLAAEYFRAPPPKSTGRELFDVAYLAALIDRCRAVRPMASTADVVATATALTARSIADALRRFVPEPITEMLISGGGARNATLTRMIGALVPDIAVTRFDEVYFDGEAKEAVAFAFLAHLFVSGRAGNVVRATGAAGRRVLGTLTPRG